MAPHVGISPRTVQRDLQTTLLVGRQGRSDRGRSRLNPAQAARRERWKAGCRPAARLWRERNARGYTGRSALVAADVRRVRQAQGLAPGPRRTRHARPVVAESPYPPLTSRRVSGRVLRHAETRPAAEAPQLAQLHAQQADVAEAIDLAPDCTPLLRQRPPEPLDPWLARAAQSTLEAWQRLAKGLCEDDAAVNAGGTLPWSTGPVDGHINRLTMLKRQMFGRARLELLSRRFVLVPGPYPGPCPRPA